ncbi:MAG: RNB domain-containing ribonuclease [Actinomycetota bacterium]|nr:RNB domain-containing ribonuclease [Actinomycetota bacterium]
MDLSTARGRRRLRTAALSFEAIRAELGVRQGFPAAVLADAQDSVDRGPQGARTRLDLPFVTIDPAESLDLDQALHIERSADGFLVHYAIADVAAFVRPGGPMDNESWRRGVTLYSPDTRTPLYPQQLSEEGASLLPDKDRPALVWALTLDAAGNLTGVEFAPKMVRSIAKLNYAQVQADMDNAAAHASIAALAELGPILTDQARGRGAIELPMPDQEVVQAADGSWQLSFRAQLPVERWNAQISLLTGRAAAQMMLDAGVGLLRTLPAADQQAVEQLRRVAASLTINWPPDASPGEVLSTVDGSRPQEAAFVDEAAGLLRGSGYTAFDGSPPEHAEHAGVGAAYAHVTAPLRRLADRYANEVCLAIQESRDVQAWARDRLPELPAAMTAGDRRDSELERACLDSTEAAILADRRGEIFDGVVVEVDDRGNRDATVVLTDLAVRARCVGPGLVLGTTVRVRVTEADVASRTVRLTVAR